MEALCCVFEQDTYPLSGTQIPPSKSPGMTEELLTDCYL